MTPLGHSLLNHPSLLKWLSRVVFLVEWTGPVLAFTPVLTAPVRLVLVLAFAVLHLGFGMCLRLGLFPVISVLSWVPFLPSQFWDTFSQGSVRVSEEVRPALHGSTVAGLVAFLLLLYVAWWNVGALPGGPRMPDRLRWVGNLLRLDQRWKLFAPVPLRDDGWYVIPGNLDGGGTVDIFRGGQRLAWTKPALVSATYKNQRWRKYLMNLSGARFAAYRHDYARYLCRVWNNEGRLERPLRALRIYFMRETTLPGYGVAKVHRALLLRHVCRAERPPKVAAAVGTLG